MDPASYYVITEEQYKAALPYLDYTTQALVDGQSVTFLNLLS